MALKRNDIRAILENESLSNDEKISKIIGGHLETVDGLKTDLDKAKRDAERFADVQKELDTLKQKQGENDFEKKFNEEHQAFEDYKKQVATEKENSEKQGLYKALLKDSGVGEKFMDSILKVTDLSKVIIKDGKIENTEDLTKSIKDDWAGFIVTEGAKGGNVDNPPTGGGGQEKSPENMSFAEYKEWRKKGNE